MARRYLGVTLFGWLAITAVPFYVGGHTILRNEIASLGFSYASSVVWTAAIVSAIGVLLLRTRRSALTLLIIRFGFVWIGAAFILAVSILLCKAVAAWFPITRYAGLPFGAGVLLLAVFHARVPTVSRHRIEAAVEQPVRMVLLADLHLGDFYGTRWLANLVLRVELMAPDVVVIAGDLIDGMSVRELGMMGPLARLDAPLLFVRGNHETYSPEPELAVKAISEAGIRMMSNEVVNYRGLAFVGLDYPVRTEVRNRLCRETGSLPIVLIEHRPAAAPESVPDNVALMVSGHTHGGQIWPFGYLSMLELPLWRGKNSLRDGTVVYVTPGTATWGPPYRLGTRSEITIFDFIPAREVSQKGGAA